MTHASHEIHRANIEAIRDLLNGTAPDDFDERERLYKQMILIHAGALTPVSEDEKRGVERVLAILNRKLGEGGAVVGEGARQHNEFYKGRWSAFQECAIMLQSALKAETAAAPPVSREGERP